MGAEEAVPRWARESPVARASFEAAEPKTGTARKELITPSRGCQAPGALDLGEGVGRGHHPKGRGRDRLGIDYKMRLREKLETVDLGSGDVLVDLGFADAGER